MHQTSLPSTTAEQSPALPVHGAHGSRRLRVLVVGTLLLTLTVTWLLVAVLLNTKWQDAVRSQERQNANLARVLEEQTLRVLAAADQATLRVAAEVRSGEFSEQDYALFANETGLAPDILTQLSIVGPDGRFVGSNLDPSAARNQDTDLSEREHIRVHLEPGKEPRARTRMSASGLFVGRPVTGRVSGRRTMQLSRPIVGSNRYLHGVVVASLNPGYFEQVYGSVDIGAQGAVALMGADFNVLARVIGAQAESIDKTIEFPPGHPLTDTTRTQGTYQRVSHIDGLGRITAFHRVPGYPLTVLVSTTDDEALAEWKTMRTFTVVFAGLFSATLIALGAGFLRGLHQLEQKNLALAASEAQARSANRAKSEFLTAISHELRTPSPASTGSPNSWSSAWNSRPTARPPASSAARRNISTRCCPRSWIWPRSRPAPCPSCPGTMPCANSSAPPSISSPSRQCRKGSRWKCTSLPASRRYCGATACG